MASLYTTSEKNEELAMLNNLNRHQESFYEYKDEAWWVSKTIPRKDATQMVSSYATVDKERLAILEEFKKQYKPFFEYEADLKKNIFRVMFHINDQERTVRIDPQFKDRQLEDLIAGVENAKDAIINRARADALKEAKEKLKEIVKDKKICGHEFIWTYAFELKDMEGFMCQEENLFLPVEYDDVFELNAYSVKIHDDWYEKAEKYLEENFGKQTFVKRMKCPDLLKDFVIEFAASQRSVFAGHDRYVCQVQEEYIPDKDEYVRWHFEFGDFIEKDGKWEYVKDSGIYSMYDNDIKSYMELYSAFDAAIPDNKDLSLTNIEGPGLYYGKTKIRINVGPFYREAEIDPDMNNWQESVCNRINEECIKTQNIVWSKVVKCLDNLLNRDVAELVTLHETLTPSTIASLLNGTKTLFPTVDHAGFYSEYSKQEFDKAITELIACKLAKKEQKEAGGKPYIAISMTSWGNDMLKKHKKSLNNVESRIQKAITAYEQGNEPTDENAAALLKTIKTRKKSSEKDEEYLAKIAQNKNVATVYKDVIEKLQK